MARATLLLIISVATFGLIAAKASSVFQEDPGFETRIQTGKIVKRVPPYIAALKYKDGGVFCTASIISPDRILTAAHCTVDSLGVFQVVAGLLDVRTENVNQNLNNPKVSIIDYENQDIVIHENYTGGGEGRFLNDIYIIKLQETLKSVFKPVLLPLDDEKYRDKLKGLGWGLYDCKNSSPENLREADGKYIDLATCYKGYAPKDIPESKLCAKFTSEGNPAAVAPGDSGGPLVSLENSSQPVQIGLTSTVSLLSNTKPGEICENKDTPQVYTRVSSFSQFIKQHAPN